MQQTDNADDRERDSTYWLAMLIRQGLKLIVAGIERRYRVGQFKPKRERAAPIGGE